MATPALWRTLSLRRRLLQWDASPFYPLPHRLHIRTGLERLRKVADVADDILVSLERERHHRLLTGQCTFPSDGVSVGSLGIVMRAALTMKQKVNHGWLLMMWPL